MVAVAGWVVAPATALQSRYCLILTSTALPTRLVAGPGFISYFPRPAFLADSVNRALQSERLGVTTPQAQTIVVDYRHPAARRDARRPSTFDHH
ncbi:hypothetical protein MJ561_18925 [Klebsiella pneumoniae]|nr:hypothetical protein MJ561_18925 [Klebsiella pneumoniae]